VAVGRAGGACEVRDAECGAVAAVIEATSSDMEGEEDCSIRGLHLFLRQYLEARWKADLASHFHTIAVVAETQRLAGLQKSSTCKRALRLAKAQNCHC
jgi:hypothetical protein